MQKETAHFVSYALGALNRVLTCPAVFLAIQVHFESHTWKSLWRAATA